jgi:hypothetical protein
MRKTNDTSGLAKLEDRDALANTELDAVSGGLGFAPFAPQVFAVCVATMDFWITHANEYGGGNPGPGQCTAPN